MYDDYRCDESYDPCIATRQSYLEYLDNGSIGAAYAIADALLSEMEGWVDAYRCKTYAHLVSQARRERPDWLCILHTHPDAGAHMISYMGLNEK